MSRRPSDLEVLVRCLRSMVLAGMIGAGLVAGLCLTWWACHA